jgi:hypothetical protein
MSNIHNCAATDPYLEKQKQSNRLKIKEKDKFKNLPEIDSYIRTLYETVGVPLIPRFDTDLSISSSSNPQSAAKQIANFFGLDKIQPSVSFVNNLGVPGRVHLSHGNAFPIEIDKGYSYSPNVISAILAHEIAHIYLFKHNIAIQDTLQNEILTDTTAAFLGCANLILNSSYEQMASHIETKVIWFGYITQYEVGYVQAKRDFLLRQDSSKAMIYGRSEEFFEEGRAHFLKSLGRPYVKPSALGKTADLLKSLLNKRSVVFRCIGCGQRLRIPARDTTLSVHCPTCRNNLLCYS